MGTSFVFEGNKQLNADYYQLVRRIPERLRGMGPGALKPSWLVEKIYPDWIRTYLVNGLKELGWDVSVAPGNAISVKYQNGKLQKIIAEPDGVGPTVLMSANGVLNQLHLEILASVSEPSTRLTTASSAPQAILNAISHAGDLASLEEVSIFEKIKRMWRAARDAGAVSRNTQVVQIIGEDAVRELASSFNPEFGIQLVAVSENEVERRAFEEIFPGRVIMVSELLQTGRLYSPKINSRIQRLLGRGVVFQVLTVLGESATGYAQPNDSTVFEVDQFRKWIEREASSTSITPETPAEIYHFMDKGRLIGSFV